MKWRFHLACNLHPHRVKINKEQLDKVKMYIDKDGYLNVSIEQKADKKDEKKEDVKQIEVK